MEPEKLIPLHGGYRRLTRLHFTSAGRESFQVAQLVYDVTVRFCDATFRRAAAPTTRWMVRMI